MACEGLVQVANLLSGMFLWVRLIMKSLEDCNSEPELIDAINTLPDGLHEACVKVVKWIHSLS